jgi:acyl-coenzyme A synthetase/AMP-(fatty) acid ligase
VTDSSFIAKLVVVSRKATRNAGQVPSQAWLDYYENGIEPSPSYPEKPLYALLDEELNHFPEDRMAHFEMPRSYDFRSGLPKTAVGKIHKKMLSDEYRASAKENV